ncbi:MAG: hypothetical protein AAB425_05750, partial [Bdellovibrionota bacterium]
LFFLFSEARKKWMKISLAVVGAYGLAGLLAAPQLLPLFAVMRTLEPAYRVGMGNEGVAFDGLIRSIPFPDYGHWSFILHPGWLGVFGIVTVALGLIIAIRRRSGIMAFLVFMAFLYVSKTINIPFFGALVNRLPYVTITHPSRDLSLWLWFPFSMLTAYGISELPKVSKWGRAVSIGVALAVGMGSLGLVRNANPNHWRNTLIALVLITGYFFVWSRFRQVKAKRAAVVMAGILIFGTFLAMPRKKSPRQDLGVQPLAALAEPLKGLKPWEKLSHAWPGSRCMSQWSAVYGYNGFVSSEPLMPERYFRFMSHFFQCGDGHCFTGVGLPKTQDPLLAYRLSGLNYLLSINNWWNPGLIGTGAAGVREVFRHPTQRIQVYAVDAPVPKAFATRQCEIVPKFQAIYDRITLGNKMPTAALIDEQAGLIPEAVQRLCREAGGAGGLDPVEIGAYTDSTVQMKTDFTDERILVLSDLFHHDWIAEIDGARTAVFPGFGVYRGIHLPPGSHKVEFRYFPVTFYVGVALFALAVALIAFGWRVRAIHSR